MTKKATLLGKNQPRQTGDTKMDVKEVEIHTSSKHTVVLAAPVSGATGSGSSLAAGDKMDMVVNVVIFHLQIADKFSEQSLHL